MINCDLQRFINPDSFSIDYIQIDVEQIDESIAN